MTVENLERLGFKEGKDYNDLAHIIEMSHGENVKILYEIGAADAKDEIKAEHFRQAFDLKPELVS